MSTRRMAAALIVLLMAGAAVLLNRHSFLPVTETASQASPDAWATDITLSIMDADGRPAYRMTSDKMTHYGGSGLLTLEQPLLYISRAGGSHWQIAAERGEANMDDDRVWLPGPVRIERLPGNGEAALSVTTLDVTVKPALKLAETDAMTELKTGLYTAQAVGMKADINRNRLELLSRVRSTIHAGG